MQQWLRTMVLLFVSMIALVGFASNGLAESHHNVLFISVDDLRPELACYGDSSAQPSLARQH